MGHRPSSAVPDETPHNASSHQGLHCLLERTPIYVKITEIKTMCKLIVEQFQTGILTLNCSRRHYYYFYFYLSEKITLDISCESSVKQRIHMKYQALFIKKNKMK